MGAIAMRVAMVGLVAALLGFSGPVHSAQDDPRLDALFEALGDTSDPATAEVIEATIVDIWDETDDSSNARLLQQGDDALARGLLPVAAFSFNRLVDRAPDFAEAWNRRAILHFVMGNDTAALADIERTLELEPRHFGAMSGLAMIMLRNDRPEVALRSFEAVLEVHPHFPAALDNLEPLRQLVVGLPA